ncbi:syncytin-2-like [Lissotriton helveticus]
MFSFDMQFGTTTLMDYYWACGEHLYIQLPPQWLGLCTLVTLHEIHLVVPASNASHILSHPMTGDLTFLHRHRRAAEYFATEARGKVPEEFRLFNEAQLFFGGAFPIFQTQANARWLEVTRYEVMKAINSTRDGLNAIREELRPLRLMVLEHRYFLDMLTAKDGGLCHQIGKSCCTFIPGNDEDNGSISRAIEELTNLGKDMIEEGGAPADIIPTNWFDFDWMPSWLTAILKLMIPIVGIMVFLCCAFQLGSHCIKKLSTKAVGMNYARTGIYEIPRYEGMDRAPGDGNGEQVQMIKLVQTSTHPAPLATHFGVPPAPPLPQGRHTISNNTAAARYECLINKLGQQYTQLLRSDEDVARPTSFQCYVNDMPWIPPLAENSTKYSLKNMFINEQEGADDGGSRSTI